MGGSVGLEIVNSKNAEELGVVADKAPAEKLRAAIEESGRARIILSTGASQFETLKALTEENVDWSKVEMFHLDEHEIWSPQLCLRSIQISIYLLTKIQQEILCNL